MQEVGKEVRLKVEITFLVVFFSCLLLWLKLLPGKTKCVTWFVIKQKLPSGIILFHFFFGLSLLTLPANTGYFMHTAGINIAL